MRKWLFLLVVLGCALGLGAQTMRAWVDRNQIGINETLKLTVELENDQGSRFHLPEIDGMRQVGASQSSTTSMQINNFKASTSIKTSWRFVLQPTRLGNILIPPLSLPGTNITQPIAVNVTTQSTTASPYPGNLQYVGRSRGTAEVFMQAELSKNSAYMGEPLDVNYWLYMNYDPYDVNLGYREDPEFKDFWKEESFRATHPDWQRTEIKGRHYYRMLVRTLNLMPTRSGRLLVPGMEMNVGVVEAQGFFFDTKKLVVKADDIYLNALPLPEEGKPAGFSGAVGNFILGGECSKSSIQVGDAVTLTLTVQGTGNHKQFSAPVASTGTLLRALDTVSEYQLNGATRGKSIFTYSLVGVDKGREAITPLEFSFFNPDTKKYVTLTYDPGTIEILPGAPGSGNTRLDPYEYRSHHQPKGIFVLMRHWYYWFILALLIATFPLIWWQHRQLQSIAGDPARQASLLAKKMVRRYLKEASRLAHAGDAGFYTAAQAGLGNYLADYTGLPRGSRNDDLLNTLEELHPQELICAQVRDFVQLCDVVRFMPGGGSQASPADHLQQLTGLLAGLEALRRKNEQD